MEHEAKRPIKHGPESRIRQTQHRDQRESNPAGKASNGAFSYKLEEELIARARLKRASILAARPSSSKPLLVAEQPPGAEEPPPAAPGPVAQAEAARPSTEPRSGLKTYTPMVAVGALVIGVVVVNGWYLGSRIDANTHRLNTVASDKAEVETENTAQSGELKKTLERARVALNAGLITEPAGGSALDYYRDALDIEPGNPEAQAGLRAVTDQLLLRAEAALQAQQFAEAANALQSVRGIDAELPLLDLLEAQIDRERSSMADAKQAPQPTRSAASPPATRDSEPVVDARAAVPVKNTGEKVVAASVATAAVLATDRRPQANTVTQVKAVPRPAMPAKPAPAPAALKESTSSKASAQSAPAVAVAPGKVNSPAAVSRPTAASDAAVIAAPVFPDRALETDVPDLAKLQPESMATEGIDSVTAEESAPPEAPVGEGPVAKAALSSAPTAAQQVKKPVALKRVKWVEPVTPSIAVHQGLSGWVNVAFTVTTEGKTADVEVADSHPRQIFDRAAIASVQQWRFEPPMREGEPVSERTMVRIRFVVTD